MAQDYPNKPIKFIVPLTPGSGADIAGRIVAKHLTDIWKQPIVVENRPGAGGQIGTQAVIRSEPDGYTLLVQSASHAAEPPADGAAYRNVGGRRGQFLGATQRGQHPDQRQLAVAGSGD